MTRGQIAGVAVAGLILFVTAFGVGYAQTHGKDSPGPQRVGLSSLPASGVSGREQTSSTAPVTTTTLPCVLSGGSGASRSVPVDQVCSSAGAPHFDTPESAMTYLAKAWNSNDVQQIDYVTNPSGRQQMDSMATQMIDLRFDHCTPNPTGDYTCYFQHDIAASTSPTTYPNPGHYPPGEAVFHRRSRSRTGVVPHLCHPLRMSRGALLGQRPTWSGRAPASLRWSQETTRSG